jgi:hypothetical protein
MFRSFLVDILQDRPYRDVGDVEMTKLVTEDLTNLEIRQILNAILEAYGVTVFGGIDVGRKTEQLKLARQLIKCGEDVNRLSGDV